MVSKFLRDLQDLQEELAKVPRPPGARIDWVGPPLYGPLCPTVQLFLVIQVYSFYSYQILKFWQIAVVDIIFCQKGIFYIII